jgi:hypothetical protein
MANYNIVVLYDNKLLTKYIIGTNFISNFGLNGQVSYGIIQFFEQHPVFTRDEFVGFLVAQGTTNPHTQRELLTYHVKKQHMNLF